MPSVGSAKPWQGNGMADAGDREFESRLGDHADIRAAYRTASAGDQPPASLDAAILAASRRAVNAGPARVDRPGRFVGRMAVPLSVAAVMVLATSLSFLVYEERGDPSAPDASRGLPAPAAHAPKAEAPARGDLDIGARAPASPAPAPAAVEPPQQASKADAGATTRSRTAQTATGTGSFESREAPSRAMPAPLLSSASAPSAAGAAPESLADGAEARPSVDAAREERASAAARSAAARQTDRQAAGVEPRREAVAASAGAPPIAEAPARLGAKRLASPAHERAVNAAPGDEATPQAVPSADETPDAWVSRIRVLVDIGRMQDARVEVARLRCRHPDIALPADLPVPAAGVDCPATAAKEGSPDLR